MNAHTLEITEVASRADLAAFIKFPWRIYANDPAWVPPLIIERKEFLDRKKHPFYKHGDAALFLARRGGKIVGRIMASDDPNYNSVHQSNVGCFGLFESINDAGVAAALFKAATGWLHLRGRDEIMGPIDYSTNYVCGLLVHGFEHPPMILTSHNPPYYEALVESAGFTKTMDFYAWWFAQPDRAAKRLRRLAGARKERQSFSIRPINLANLSAESGRIREVYNEAWQNNWGFVPFTPAEFEHMAREMKPLVIEDLTLVAEVNGEPAAFILTLPDINAVVPQNGRLTTFGLPLGLAKLLYGKSRLKRMRLVALGVVPKHRRSGIAEMLVLRVIETGMIERGYFGECSMTLEDNHMINRFLEAIGADRYKTYRIYRRRIDD